MCLHDGPGPRIGSGSRRLPEVTVSFRFVCKIFRFEKYETYETGFRKLKPVSRNFAKQFCEIKNSFRMIFTRILYERNSSANPKWHYRFEAHRGKKSRVSTLQSLLSIGELNRLRATCEEGEGNLSYLMPAFLPPSKCSDA